MKLLKKIAPLCLLLIGVICLAFTACGDDGTDGGNNGGNPPCTHTEQTDIPEVSATCTEEGKTAGKKCTACNEITAAPETIPALGHTDSDGDNVCDVCENDICKHINTEISAAGTPATCTEAGKTDEYKCSDCGETTAPMQTIPAKGHIDADNNDVCDECQISVMIYTITVLDTEGNPIEGVTFEFSTITAAGLNTVEKYTDENGKIQCDVIDGIWAANVVLKDFTDEYLGTTGGQIELNDERNITIEDAAVKQIAYEIIIVDENGNAVEGVSAQVCFTECNRDVSDENGRIVIYIDPEVASANPAKASVVGSEYIEVDGHNGTNYKYYEQGSKTITLTVRPNN